MGTTQHRAQIRQGRGARGQQAAKGDQATQAGLQAIQGHILALLVNRVTPGRRAKQVHQGVLARRGQAALLGQPEQAEQPRADRQARQVQWGDQGAV